MLAMRRRGVAEEEAIEPEAPAVLVKVRELELCTVRGIDAPADPGFSNPHADRFQIAFGQTEATLERKRFENAHHAARAEATADALEDEHKGVDDPVRGARAAIRNAERNALL